MCLSLESVHSLANTLLSLVTLNTHVQYIPSPIIPLVKDYDFAKNPYDLYHPEVLHVGSSPTVTTRLELFSVAPRSARVMGTSLYMLYGYVQPHLKDMVLELF